ncbi:MAG: hypothetical protein SWE60_16125 [Thermodesulfobacteriota bacterium]|nr:hypothetical protein [Thermodesulfobacteriota bacterium]
MEWINAVVIIAVLLMALHQKKRVKALEKTLAVQKEQLASQANMMAAHKDMLASQKEALATYRDLLDNTTPPMAGDVHEEPRERGKTTEEESLYRKRQEMTEEKSRFEREVRERTKTMEWFEKEFSIGLDALLELFLHVPLRVRESIIRKMPNSVIKKGFKRLSDTAFRA